MRKLLILLVLFIAVGIVNAQKPYVTNQYVYDLFQMNPAAAAYQKNCVSVNGFYQKQWFGTDLAPTTQIVSFQMPLESRLGSGTYVYNDRNGVIKELGLSQAFSYELLLHKNRRRFSTVITSYSIHYTKLYDLNKNSGFLLLSLLCVSFDKNKV